MKPAEFEHFATNAIHAGQNPENTAHGQVIKSV